MAKKTGVFVRSDQLQLQAWIQVVAFNNRHDIGSTVTLRSGKQCKISAQAFVLPNGTAYIVGDGATIRLSEVDDGTDKIHAAGAIR